MARFIAIFALVLGVSAQDIETLKRNSQTLELKLASFETKDLKDAKVYAEYVAVRDAAKNAAAMLESNAPQEVPAAKLKVEETVETEEDLEEDVADEAVEQEDEAVEKEEQVEDKKEEKVATKTHKKKKMVLKTKQEVEADAKAKGEKAAAAARQFSSAYKLASKKPEPQEIEVIDEGKGNYGKYKDKIFGSSSSLLEMDQEVEEPEVAQNATAPHRRTRPHARFLARNFSKTTPLPGLTQREYQKVLDAQRADKLRKQTKLMSAQSKKQQYAIKAQLAKRDKKITLDMQYHDKAIKMAAHAHKLCGDSQMCNQRVNQKLQHGFYDRFLARTLD